MEKMRRMFDKYTREPESDMEALTRFIFVTAVAVELSLNDLRKRGLSSDIIKLFNSSLSLSMTMIAESFCKSKGIGKEVFDKEIERLRADNEEALSEQARTN